MHCTGSSKTLDIATVHNQKFTKFNSFLWDKTYFLVVISDKKTFCSNSILLKSSLLLFSLLFLLRKSFILIATSYRSYPTNYILYVKIIPLDNRKIFSNNKISSESRIQCRVTEIFHFRLLV